MPRSVYYVAMSVDGFIADRDGAVAWLTPFQSPELGYQAFVDKVGAVVMGRITYEQSLTFGPWAYPGRSGLIVTSRPLSGLPEGVTAVHPGELAPAVSRLRKETKGDLWVVGGARTARACLDAGLIDELEVYLVPRLLGGGVPLLEPGQAVTRFSLLETWSYSSGIVMLRYRLER